MTMKLVKTATALALGASLISTAVVSTDASAASKYKISKGKLVIAKTGKVAKGFVTYKSLVYKDGKKLTGLKGKTYYKAGKKATGTYKGAYYYKGAQKVTTGTYKGAYYVKGVKKVTTGLYNNRYYKSGVKATGTYKGAYYVKGVKKVTTGYYAGAYYVKGYKKVTTGFYNDVLYIKGKENKELAIYKDSLFDGSTLNEDVVVFEEKLFDGHKLNKGYKLYKEDLYNNENLNTGKVVFEGKLFDGAKLSKGLVPFTEEGKKELVYNDGELANGTFEVEGKEVAYENGIEVAAKVASVKVVNGTTIEVKFNKAVDEKSAKAESISLDGAALGERTLSADGRTLTVAYTLNSGVTEFKNATLEINPIVTKADEKVKTPKYVEVINFKDVEAPAFAKTEVKHKADGKVDVTLFFNKELKSIGTVSVDGIVSTTKLNADNKSITIKDVKAGSSIKVDVTNLEDKVGNKTASVSSTVVTSEDKVAPTATLSVEGTTVKVVFSEEVNTAAAVVTGNGEVLTLEKDAKEDFYTIDAASLLKGATFLKDVKFSITNVKDLAGNVQTAPFELTATIKVKDAVVAKFVNATVSADAKSITVNYDNEVVNGSDNQEFGFDLRTPQDVLLKGQKVSATAAKLSEDKKSVTYTLAAPLANGSYDFTFGENKFAATVNVATAPEEAKANITYGATIAKNVITVNYASENNLDNSAKLAENYTLAGKPLPAGTTLEFVNNKKTVEITLPAGSVEQTGVRVLKAANVKDEKGNTLKLDVADVTVELTDNVAPTTNGTAVFSTSKVATVSFSEELAANSAIAGVTVKVNGTVLEAGKYDLSVVAGKLVITAKEDLKLNDIVTIVLDAKTNNLADAAGNLAIVK